MTETSSPEPDKSQPNGSIIPYSQQSSDIVIIKQAIAEKIASAETLEEMREGLALRAELESQIEISKNNQYQRNLGTAREARLRLGSLTTILMGSGFIALDIFGKLSYTRYAGVFIILLGLVKLLEYSPSEVSGLLESFGNYLTRTNKNFPQSNSEDNQIKREE